MTILVAGHSGLVGSAIFDALQAKGETVIGISSNEVDLKNRTRTFEFINDTKPDVVIDAAAKVGGISANFRNPVEFISVNLQIQTNLMDASHAANVERFVFLGSSCIYPKESPQPIKEEYLLSGQLEITNSSYAIAKIAGIEQIKSYRRQFGRPWISLMPTNIYGPKDNFDIDTAHVLPALVNRFVSATTRGAQEVVLWGTGKPKREFLFNSDLADAVLLALDKYDDDIHLNVGTGEDISISQLAEKIAIETGFNGKIAWDTSKPDGTMRKVLDVSRVKSLGWTAKTDLETGIARVVSDYRSRNSKVER
jgi:GDP-L-fucose synthase